LHAIAPGAAHRRNRPPYFLIARIRKVPQFPQTKKLRKEGSEAAMTRFSFGKDKTGEHSERSPVATDDTNAEVTAKDILSERKEVFGTLYLISFADIFETLGECSSRLRDAVQLICRRAVERHLGIDDTVEIEQNDVYALRVSGASDEEAWRKVIAIVDEVGVNVLGKRYVRSKTNPMIRIAISEAADLHDGDGFSGDAAAHALGKVRGRSHSEIFSDWKEFQAGKGTKTRGEWTAFSHAGHGSGSAIPASGNTGPKKGSFRTRTAAERRKSKTLFKGQDRRRHFDRRGRGY
jgi:hypothetical protein